MARRDAEEKGPGDAQTVTEVSVRRRGYLGGCVSTMRAADAAAGRAAAQRDRMLSRTFMKLIYES